MEKDSKSRMVKLKKMGEGTYGAVYKAQDNLKNQVVAVKKIKFTEEDQGIPATAIRQIAILRQLSHPNIIKLKEVTYNYSKSKLQLILEFAPQTLHEHIKQHFPISPHLIKSYLFQILSALEYLTSKRIIHRDLKPQNILVTEQGHIKICDFGLAKTFSLNHNVLTPDVETLWYRAPELLLGTSYYDCSAEMWAIGCIMAEIAQGKPLFPGSSEIEQIFKIFQLIGTPSYEQYGHILKNCQHFSLKLPRFRPQTLELKYLDPLGADLLGSMLNFEYSKRPTPKQAMNHPYFEGVTLEY